MVKGEFWPGVGGSNVMVTMYSYINIDFFLFISADIFAT